MNKAKLPNSLSYLVEEFYGRSNTIQKDIVIDKSYQIFTND